MFIVGVGVISGLQLFLDRTSLGRAMRATSDDPETVNLMGLDDRRVYALATAIAFGTVGLGSLWGTLAGGVVLAVAQTLGSQINPSYGVLIGNLVFLVILAIPPSGLTPKAVAA